MNDVKLFRKVLVFDTAKQSKVEFESSATIWGDLKKELSKYDIGTSNCKFIEGSTKLTLEQEQALVPTKDFVIFKMPVSTKSAATPTFTSAQYKEEIKRHISNDAAAKTFFAGYSSMKVDELASIIKKYEAKVKKDQAKAAKVTTTAAPKAVPPKVAAKPTSKAKEPVKVEKVPTKKVEKIVSTKAEKPIIAKKPVVKAEIPEWMTVLQRPEWMTLLQRCADIAPAHIAESVNYIISKELEVPTITTDVAALAIMAKQLK